MRTPVGYVLGLWLTLAPLWTIGESTHPTMEKGYETVTFGSVVKLTHRPTQHKIHSEDIRYGSGSGQRSVTGLNDRTNVRSLWLVLGSAWADGDRGQSVSCGSIVRFQHVASGNLLHSHDHRSPLSKNNEVSAFDGQDEGDHWVVECAKGRTEWLRENPVYLKHQVTGQYLSASNDYKFHEPLDGHLEIFTSKSRGENCKWVTQEGFYLKAQSS
ncbi:hypothetical protein IWQ62_004641 [Dispira parvispora]|uniref:MIR domain-containing protein n=1 Tax=Dispira parvispora TaxID=1520584 RepID=A0A9W8AL83_9FUNG|nr:hypothetical protein IWQ62_004641 [Dispira parvispora]